MNYAQFEKEAKSAGLYDSFSQEDLALARKDPSKGMKILGYKIDYNNATTDEARLLANAGAESIRSSAGYFGGEDGNTYESAGNVSPSSYGYTYEDVVKKAQEAGVYSQISEADMELAKRNPDFGMATVYNKIGYNSAATTEEKEKFNQNQEALRSSYGGYTGGADGSGFVKNPLAPRDFSRKEYESEYKGDVDDLYGQMVNYKDFSYDAEKDPLYAQYKKQYTREGQRATADTMGQVAAMTGGIPSSYAAQAAAQAGNYYAAQLSDKIPELYQLKYNQYMNEYAMLGDKLKVAQGLDDTAYGRYLKDENFRYGQHIDEINNQKIGREEALQSEILADERGYRDKVYEDNKARNERSENMTEKDFAAKQRALTFEQELSFAKLAAEGGNYGPMNELAKKYNIPGWQDVSGTVPGAPTENPAENPGALTPIEVTDPNQWQELINAYESEENIPAQYIKKF